MLTTLALLNYRTLKHLITLILIFLFVLSGDAQEKYTLSGYVRDNSNGEELLGVTVYNDSLRVGTTTNLYGFYSMTLNAGNYNIIFQFIGFKNREIAVPVSNTILNISFVCFFVIFYQDDELLQIVHNV